MTVTTVWTIISFNLDTERPLHSKLNQPLQRINFSVARMHSHAKKSLRLLNLDGNLDRSRSVYTVTAASDIGPATIDTTNGSMAVLARLAHLHTPQPRRAFTVSS